MLIVVFLAWHFAQIRRLEPTTAFSDFLAALYAGEVGAVDIDLHDKGPGAVFRVIMADGRHLRVDGLYSDAVLQSLLAAEVPFWVSTDDTPAWSRMLIAWAPFLLLIAFWILFVSKFKSGARLSRPRARH